MALYKLNVTTDAGRGRIQFQLIVSDKKVMFRIQDLGLTLFEKGQHCRTYCTPLKILELPVTLEKTSPENINIYHQLHNESETYTKSNILYSKSHITFEGLDLDWFPS